MVNGVSGNGCDVTSMWQVLFNKMDQNGDGTIDKTELESIVSESGLDADDIFSKLDTDEDGTIAQTEFENALSALRTQGPPPPPLRANMEMNPEGIFNKIDEDDDGSITKGELTSFIEQNVFDIDKIFEEVDADNNGVISRSESDTHLQKMKEEMKGGSPPGPLPDFAMNDISDRQDWESKMLEKLMNSLFYDQSSESISRYA
jgi:Ca2+-binding EF-hand superfamily protein